MIINLNWRFRTFTNKNLTLIYIIKKMLSLLLKSPNLAFFIFSTNKTISFPISNIMHLIATQMADPGLGIVGKLGSTVTFTGYYDYFVFEVPVYVRYVEF